MNAHYRNILFENRDLIKKQREIRMLTYFIKFNTIIDKAFLICHTTIEGVSMMYLKRIIVFLAFFVAVASPHPSSAETNMLFILDGSGSMWGQIDGIAKIQTAKETLGTLLKDLPPDSKLGLMVYGHRSEGDCKDVEVVSGIGETDAATLTAKINAISPQGKTPISFSLESALPVFESFKGKNNHIILISDGIETCGGDPCASSKMLADAGINVKVHVVGFDVTGDAKKQLQCIADNGGGKYFDASSADAFKEAVEELKQVAEATPEPVKEPELYFIDDFDGDELKEHWEVINPDPDAFIVEEGSLLVIGSKKSDLSTEDIPNLFKLNKPMPEGDWSVTAKFTIDLNTSLEKLNLALYNDKENYIAALILSINNMYWGSNPYYGHGVKLQTVKNENAKITAFEAWVAKTRCLHCGPEHAWAKTMQQTFKQPVYLRLEKKGRKYSASAKIEGAEEWVKTDELTSLRAKGNLVIGIAQLDVTTGESVLKVDWVKIETP